MTPAHVRVEWVDIQAHGGAAWKRIGKVKPDPAHVTSVGWLVYEDGEYIVLAQDVSKDGYASGLATYPRGCIRAIERI